MEEEMDFENRILTPEYEREDSDIEGSLRPKTLQEYIGQEKAKEYLARTEYTVKDVARAVGYADPNYFSKLFKKVTNMTATEYKESYGKGSY